MGVVLVLLWMVTHYRGCQQEKKNSKRGDAFSVCRGVISDRGRKKCSKKLPTPIDHCPRVNKRDTYFCYIALIGRLFKCWPDTGTS